MMKKRKIAVFLTMIAISLLIAVPVAAKPYKDLVISWTISRNSYKAVKYLKKHHAFDGVIKGKKYYPERSFSGKQLHKIFVNLYGKKIPITRDDKKFWKKPVRSNYLIRKIERVSKTLKKPIKWFTKGNNLEVRRDLIANMIFSFCSMDKKFRPRK